MVQKIEKEIEKAKERKREDNRGFKRSQTWVKDMQEFLVLFYLLENVYSFKNELLFSTVI